MCRSADGLYRQKVKASGIDSKGVWCASLSMAKESNIFIAQFMDRQECI